MNKKLVKNSLFNTHYWTRFYIGKKNILVYILEDYLSDTYFYVTFKKNSHNKKIKSIKIIVINGATFNKTYIFTKKDRLFNKMTEKILLDMK